MLPSLGQHNLQSPDAGFNRFPYTIDYLDSEAIQQRQASLNKKAIDPASDRIRPAKEGTAAIIGSARRPEYRVKLGSAIQGSGINTSLVAEARKTILQAECKR